VRNQFFSLLKGLDLGIHHHFRGEGINDGRMLWRRDLTPGGQGQVNCGQGLPWVAPQSLDDRDVLIGGRQVNFIRGLRSLQDLQRTLTQFLSLAELSEFFCGIRGM